MSVRGIAARLFGGTGGKRPRVALAAFGKHPGWDDHIEDLGLESEFLTDLKRLLYIDGIGGNIENGAWHALAESGRLLDFGHVFLRRVGADLAAGRIWPSRDGRGRAAYPMIACTHADHLPLSWFTLVALPALEKVEQACRVAPSAEAVAECLADHRAALRHQADAIPTSPPPALGDGHRLADLASSPHLGPAGIGMVRLLYRVERECAAWLPVGPSSTSTRRRNLPAPTGHHLRVPGGGVSDADRLSIWAGALSDVVVPSTPLLLLTPHHRDWVDIVIGPVDAARVFPLRADTAQVPLTTSIPYDVDAEFETRARHRLGLAAGTAPAPPPPVSRAP